MGIRSLPICLIWRRDKALLTPSFDYHDFTEAVAYVVGADGLRAGNENR
ncbi:MAG: hypothetical protein IJ523_06395 [Succinivibrionaceae bacterium]|nr:hypothetical protein [Succinivibrionaceae bacterium]